LPGGCTLKRPDILFVFCDLNFYLQIEVDENGHEGYDCADEDSRLELIAADLDMPGVVLRIDPDEAPLLKRRKMRDGETAWGATPAFSGVMFEIETFIRQLLRSGLPSSVSGSSSSSFLPVSLRTYKISRIGDLVPPAPTTETTAAEN